MASGSVKYLVGCSVASTDRCKVSACGSYRGQRWCWVGAVGWFRVWSHLCDQII